MDKWKWSDSHIYFVTFDFLIQVRNISANDHILFSYKINL
jgi:hypothetical protein